MAKMTEVLYARVPAEVKAELDRIADETGLSLTMVTVEVLRRGLTRNAPTVTDRVDRAIARGSADG